MIQAVLISILYLILGPSVFADPSDSNLKLSADQAVALGLQNNLDLLAAKYSISLAEADELTAGLWPNPSFIADTVLQPFGTNWDQSSAGGPKQYDLLLSVPLDLSGKISNAKASARTATLVSEAIFQDAVRKKVLEIRLAYNEVIHLEHQLVLSYEKEAQLKRLVQTIENRIGRKQLLPLLQMRAQLARDQSILETKQKENHFKIAKSSLALLLGIEAQRLETTTSLRDFKLMDSLSAEPLVAKALQDRPDLKALKLSLEKSHLDLNLAHSQIWDNFILSAGFTSQQGVGPNPHDPSSVATTQGNSWDASITIPLPVFNRNQGNILKATQSGLQWEKQIQSLTLSIQQEVRNIVEQLILSQSLIQEYETKQVKNARQVRDTQQKLFGTGGNALLDYFDSISAYQNTLSSYYEALTDYRRGVARLNAALGRDLQL